MRKFAEFLSSVEKRPAAGYVLAGHEGFLRAEAERAVVRAVFGGDDPGPGYVTIDAVREGGNPVEPAVVLDEARTSSLFSDGKVVSAHRAGPLVKKNVELFASYLSDTGPASVLLLHVEDWDKRSAYARKLDAWAVDCSSLYETAFGESEISAGSSLGKWVRARAGARKLRISPDAIVRLIELVGNNLGLLDGALERLELAGGKGDEVSPDAVDKVAAPTRSMSQFRVASLAAGGETGRAFAAASSCFELGLADEKGRVDHNEGTIATRLLWAIGREVETLYHARGLMDKRNYNRSTAGSIGVPPFRADEVERAARSHTLGDLAGALQLVLAAETSFKSGRADGRFAVEKLIAELGGVLSSRSAGAR